ncbi:MAG: hypothetical protein KF872_08920 [Chitinophagales bacterium]|nr:hypothetical protein [Chitinophagales bacterium]
MKNTTSQAAPSLWKKATIILTTILVPMLMMQSCKKDEVSPLDTANYKTFNSNMRKLWSDHMQWTYSTVDAFFNNSDGLQAQLNRLLQNQKDIGAAIVPYYGQAAGDQLTALLTDHINKAVPVLTAAKNNDQAALNTALADWYANAEQIADFLSAANPNWAQSDMRHMMKMHIDQTTAYAVDLLKKDYTAAVQKYEEAHNHMLEMADDLSEGIAKQFPSKF